MQLHPIPGSKSNPKSQLLELVFTGSSSLAASLPLIPASIFLLAELEEENSPWTNYSMLKNMMGRAWRMSADSRMSLLIAVGQPGAQARETVLPPYTDPESLQAGFRGLYMVAKPFPEPDAWVAQ